MTQFASMLPQFAAKKPNLWGSWKEQCGDNFYSRSTDGTWFQHPTKFHVDEATQKKTQGMHACLSVSDFGISDVLLLRLKSMLNCVERDPVF